MNKIKSKKFTLVELLVVIAIISILAGMLLPALENALSAAHTISCNNMLKQHSLEFIAYSNDFDEYFYPYDLGDASDHIRWYEVIPTGGEDLQDNLRCPACTWEDDFSYSGGKINYGYATYLGGASPAPKNAKYSDIKKPSKTVLLADSLGRFLTDGNYSFSWILTGSNSRWVDVRHNDNANVIFTDNHVETKAWALPADVTAEELGTSAFRWYDQ
ncbi:MAG: type II secretion system protein [Planctomycetota bacterium]|jgi:prepilin-type N-terminal cleavage/methylation domain-containing protein/prepilin-type processing-associated H-X9-DG protein